MPSIRPALRTIDENTSEITVPFEQFRAQAIDLANSFGLTFSDPTASGPKCPVCDLPAYFGTPDDAGERPLACALCMRMYMVSAAPASA